MHTFREIKNNYNLIEIIDQGFFEKIPKDFKTEKVIEGDFVIKFKQTIGGKSLTTYTLIDSQNNLFEVYHYYNESYRFNLIFEARLKTSKIKTLEDLEFKIYDDITTIGNCKIYLSLVFDAMAYISYKLSNKKTIYKTQRTKQVKNSEKREAKEFKKKIQVLNEDKIVYLNINADSVFVKDLRSYTRRTESWDVLGHDRHLKSGKTVWVEPYKKGDKTKEVAPKKYIVK